MVASGQVSGGGPAPRLTSGSRLQALRGTRLEHRLSRQRMDRLVQACARCRLRDGWSSGRVGQRSSGLAACLIFYLNGSLAGYSGHVVFKYHGAEEHASSSSMNQFKAAVLLEHAPRILFWDVYVLSTVEHITDLR